MTQREGGVSEPLTEPELAKLRGRTRSHLHDLAEYEDIIDRLVGMVDTARAAALGELRDVIEDEKPRLGMNADSFDAGYAEAIRAIEFRLDALAAHPAEAEERSDD